MQLISLITQEGILGYVIVERMRCERVHGSTLGHAGYDVGYDN